MGDYASKGVAGSGLGLGIAGTALGLLNGNGLGGLFGCNNNCAVNAMAGNAMVATLAEKDSEIGQLKAEKYTNDQVAKTYIALNSEIGKVSDKVNELALGTEKRFGAVDSQMAVMATATNSAIQALQNTVNGITKTVIPLNVICPQAMARWNSWTAPTNTAPDTQPVTVENSK